MTKRLKRAWTGIVRGLSTRPCAFIIAFVSFPSVLQSILFCHRKQTTRFLAKTHRVLYSPWDGRREKSVLLFVLLETSTMMPKPQPCIAKNAHNHQASNDQAYEG